MKTVHHKTPPATLAKGQKTRETILNAAIQLFYKNGYDQTTFQHIADEVEITQPALYRYFKDKTQILAGCAQVAAMSGTTYIQGQLTDPRHIKNGLFRTYVEANLKWFSKNLAQSNALSAAYYFSNSSEDLFKVRYAIESAGVARIIELLNLESKKGAISAPVGRMIHSLLVGEVFKYLLTSEGQSVHERADEILSLVSRILRKEIR